MKNIEHSIFEVINFPLKDTNTKFPDGTELYEVMMWLINKPIGTIRCTPAVANNLRDTVYEALHDTWVDGNEAEDDSNPFPMEWVIL